ncbi:MAG: TIGR03620 family F420-dependent LLM class oxidoreductase [Gammaproteobacteria bacterium]|nr:TIGR03620 family F420-dependent LLM class oxidoreductase [Gammaproteobacteria bacterium]
MELGQLGVWYFTDGMSATEAADCAKRIEAMGYAALWIPETVGRNPFVHASWLLANTTSLVIATGIANIYHREPGVTLAAQHTLAEQSNDRFLLGLGVSHKPLVEGLRGLTYGKPVATMRTYLQKMKASPYAAPKAAQDPKTVIAALGPKMLELAATEVDGAHPYFTSPAHTKMAREIMGPHAWLCVEQKVIMDTDPERARATARRSASTYQGLPNYRNNWLRMGLTEDDINEAGSDAFIDATFAWGDRDAIQERIDAHLAAGASHVCIQPIRSDGQIQQPDWDALEVLSR